jgi:hypothetical protein
MVLMNGPLFVVVFVSTGLLVLIPKSPHLRGDRPMDSPIRSALAVLAILIAAYLIAGGDVHTVATAGKNVFDALAGIGAELVNKAAAARGH